VSLVIPSLTTLK